MIFYLFWLKIKFLEQSDNWKYKINFAYSQIQQKNKIMTDYKR